MSELEIKLVRLITGEEIICEFVYKGTELVVFKNPVRIVVMPNKMNPSVPSIGLAPWAEFSSDKEFQIQRGHVLVVMNPVQEFVDQYKSLFSSIALPSPPKLILPN